MKPPSRQTLDTLGITQPRGQKPEWARGFAAGIFLFVYTMTFAITEAPRWQFWVVLGVAAIALVVFSAIAFRSAKSARRAGDETPALKFDGVGVLFVAVAGVVILLIVAGTQWWGFPVTWAVVATGLFVPGGLFFVYQRWSRARRREAPRADTPPS